jgi:hypothetical protein
LLLQYFAGFLAHRIATIILDRWVSKNLGCEVVFGIMY